MRKTPNTLELKPYPQPEFIKTDAPVLLCHGYGAFASIMREGPMHDVCMFLRSHGIPAFAPNIVPYEKVEIRAKEWKNIIYEILEITGSSSLYIVAHSMAGLDIRYALYKYPELAEHVKKVVTVATPHKGTSLAELALKTPHFVMENFLKLSDWLGNKMYPDMKSNTTGAIEQLTRKHICEVFNPETGIPPVPFYSYAAVCGKGTEHDIPTILKGFNNWIFDKEGPNDGFVSEESAKLGTFKKTLYLSHSEQILMNVSAEKEELIKQEWLQIIVDMVE